MVRPPPFEPLPGDRDALRRRAVRDGPPVAGRHAAARRRNHAFPLVRQRAKAQAALGSRYDLRDFNDAVVLGGNVPMDVLAKNVEDYVTRTKRA